MIHSKYCGMCGAELHGRYCAECGADSQEYTAPSAALAQGELGVEPSLPEIFVLDSGWRTRNTRLDEGFPPGGIDVDAQGTLWMADTGTNRIRKFSATGRLVALYGSAGSDPGEFRHPVDVAVDGAGNVYVADSYNYRVQKFSPAGEPLATWGSTGTGPGEFGQHTMVPLADGGEERVEIGPQGIAVDGAGYVYVADTANHRIQKLSPEGESIALWGTPGDGAGEFTRPSGVAVRRDGIVFVADTGNQRIQILDGDGNMIDQWGVVGEDLYDVSFPAAVAVDSLGATYVVDGRLHKLSGTGKLLARCWKQERFTGVTVDSSDNVYVSDVFGAIWRLTSAPASVAEAAGSKEAPASPKTAWQSVRRLIGRSRS